MTKVYSCVHTHQIVLPSSVRSDVLKLAHEGYSEPYTVEKRLNPTKSQFVHVNLMKSYYTRNPEEVCEEPVDEKMVDVFTPDRSVDSITLCATRVQPVSVDEADEKSANFPSHHDSLSNSYILNNLSQYIELSSQQLSDLAIMFSQYPSVISDTPGYCTYLYHDVKLVATCQSPIRQSPYRLNPMKREIMEKEVTYLLNNNLAEPSMSPWPSSCLLVSKSDGSYRLCTDYRKVNRVTIRDSYPLPLIEDLIDHIGTSKYITTVDLLKGYYQIPLSEEAKESQHLSPLQDYFNTKYYPLVCVTPLLLSKD